MTAIGAIDIGGTKIAVGIVDENGHLLSRMETPSKTAEAYSDGLNLIADMLQQATRATGLAITGIGIGATGPVDPLTGRFGDLDFLPQWSGESLVDDLEKEFRVPVALENDADAAVLEEASRGSSTSRSEPELAVASSSMDSCIAAWTALIQRSVIR